MALVVLSDCSHFKLDERTFVKFEDARAVAMSAICPDCGSSCGYVHSVDELPPEEGRCPECGHGPWYPTVSGECPACGYH